MRSVVCAVIAALVVAVSSAGASAKVLSFCTDVDPEGFDPALYVARTTFDGSAQAIYNRLVEFERGSTELRPGLAESWEVAEDGLTYTFRLRPGVRFHSTPDFTPERELNADDVVFSLMRQHDPDHSWHDYAAGGWPFYFGLSLEVGVKAIRKVDDLTVEIALERPLASLPSLLAMDFASIVSKEYADALAAAGTRELLDTRPVGTGPYVFVGHDPGARVEFARNPTYWRGRQPADTLTFRIEPDPASRLEKLVSGECHIIAQPDPATLALAAANENIAIAEADRADVSYLAVNTRTAPFGDVRLRRALGMAIDRQAIVDEVFGGAASAAEGLLAPSMWGYAPAAEAPYDPEGARRLLADAGVSGLSFDLLTMTAPRPYNPDPERVAGMIAADLAEVGVDVTVVTEDLVGEFLRKASDPERSGAVLLGWTSDNGDPGAFLSLLLSCDAVGASNRAQWCNAPFDDLLRRAAVASDEEARSLIYGEAQQMLSVHQPLIAIAHTVISVPMAGTVTGFAASPLGVYNFEGVDVP